ncbi:hypothetical protein J27TS8_39060 [Robertmurraya siralis]|uniref:Uncharacterized protein n=1 Tax=Robertmurraya siralis TaxID=77777 RepID=A0A919WKS5_9BACI|nr:hypothetical protein J27TS8_39060 [Robertmurraya siralis]
MLPFSLKEIGVFTSLKCLMKALLTLALGTVMIPSIFLIEKKALNTLTNREVKRSTWFAYLSFLDL